MPAVAAYGIVWNQYISDDGGVYGVVWKKQFSDVSGGELGKSFGGLLLLESVEKPDTFLWKTGCGCVFENGIFGCFAIYVSFYLPGRFFIVCFLPVNGKVSD